MENKKYDLIVAGGGFAGFTAALSAARHGVKVLLFDKSNCLGGAASNCLVNPFMPYCTTINGEKKSLTMGIFNEITTKMYEMGGMQNGHSFKDEYLKLLMNRMLIEAGVEILYHTYLIDSEVENGEVKSVTLAFKTKQLKLYADYFIDATGDGDLSVLCGCPYHLGRESDNLCQPMTLCFRVINVDIEKFTSEGDDIQKLYKKYRQEGKIKNKREDILSFRVPIDGVIHFNSTRIVKLNPVDAYDITKAEIEVREQVFELFMFLKNNFDSFKNSELISTAAEIGVRESRMIEGEYVLTQEDLLALTKFDDSIAVGNYDIDIHNPEGSGTSHHYFKAGEYYTIPYRCLTPKKVSNLLVAGRCISSTHEAQASYRVMHICCCLGQAAGTAAAVAAHSKTSVKNIDIKELQNELVADGALIG